MPHYVTLSLNFIAVFSFPATANEQPTGGANGNDGVDVDASASENVDNNDTQQSDSMTSYPVQEGQGDVHIRTSEEIDQHEETGNSYEHLVLKNK